MHSVWWCWLGLEASCAVHASSWSWSLPQHGRRWRMPCALCPVPCALEWYQTGLGGVEEAVQQDSMDSRCYPMLKTLLLCWLSDSAACNLQFVNLPFHLRTGLTVPRLPGPS